MRHRVVHIHLRAVKVDRIRIRPEPLVVVSMACRARADGRHVALIYIKVEGRALAVVCHDERQASELVGRIVGPHGIDAQHAVGQLHGWKRRHKQMADVAHVRVDIVHRLLVGRQGRRLESDSHDGNSRLNEEIM